MKRFASAALFLIACVIFATPTFASELWTPHLNGINEGLGAGLVPPKGFYFINNFYFGPDAYVYNNDADKAKLNGHTIKIDAYIDVPVFLFSPGIKLLGADYACAVVQPFDYVNERIYGPLAPAGPLSSSGNVGGAQGGLYNTILVPFILSWALPHNLHIAPSLAIYLNDGTSSPGDAPSDKYAYAESANGYYTFEPHLGITWLCNGWNLSADMMLDFPLRNHDTQYTSGMMYAADYTATKTINKWTFGVGAYQQWQFTNDKYKGKNVSDYPMPTAANPFTPYKPGGNKAVNFGIGPIIGYNFGSVDFMLTYNFNVYAKNNVGGNFLNFRVVIPFGI